MIRTGALYVLARLLPGAAGVATTAALTRLLPPEAYGRYGIAVLVMTFGSTVGFEWLGLSFMRFHEQGRDDPRTVPTFAALYGGMTVLAALAAACAVLSGVLPPGFPVLAATGVAMACAFGWFEFLARMEVARFRPAAFLRLNLQRAVLLASGTLGAALLTHDAAWTAFGTLAGLSAALVPGLRCLPRGGFDPALARTALRFGVPFAGSMLLAGLFNSGVRALAGLLTDAEQLGFYTVSYALSFGVLAVLASALGSATFPLAVRAWERGDADALRRQLCDNLALVLGLLAPASLGLALVADDLAQVAVAPGYRSAVAGLMAPMAVAVLLAAFRGVYLDQAFQLGRMPGRQLAVSAVAAGVALGGTIMLVPLMGAVGAALAMAGAALLSCVHAAIAGRAAYRMPLPGSVFVRIGLALVAMAAAVECVPAGTPWSLWGRIAAGAASYGAVALALDLLGSRTKLLARLRWTGTARVV